MNLEDKPVAAQEPVCQRCEELEEMNRGLQRILNDELGGQSFMGEPVIAPNKSFETAEYADLTRQVSELLTKADKPAESSQKPVATLDSRAYHGIRWHPPYPMLPDGTHLYANAAPCARCAELEQKQSECIEFALYSDKRIKELQAKITEQDAFIKQIADTCTEAERIAIERAGRIDALESECRNLRARLEKAERDAEYRLDTLKEVRETLEVANVTPNGPINDTIWYSNCETLLDFMDAAIAKERT